MAAQADYRRDLIGDLTEVYGEALTTFQEALTEEERAGLVAAHRVRLDLMGVPDTLIDDFVALSTLLPLMALPAETTAEEYRELIALAFLSLLSTITTER